MRLPPSCVCYMKTVDSILVCLVPVFDYLGMPQFMSIWVSMEILSPSQRFAKSLLKFLVCRH